ncbi:hypothetical protein [Aerolutibacter daejeonensis]|uniref:hypothetical protein n=1 Tax=Aerolutibacter daejeonensis TaxID=346181 RepID=UPI00068C3D23|nr:hypothetical protein [Lysobacter daejeonensis]
MRPALVLLLSALAFAPAVLAKDAPAAAAASASEHAPDPRVKRLLDKLKYKYEVDEDGDYKLVFDLDDDDEDEKKGRSQLVYVRSPVFDYGSHEVREVWAPAYKAKSDEFPAKVANRLLEASQESKLGGWAKQGQYAVFVIKVATNASAEQLDDAINAAIQSADQMEAELTPGKDEF